MSLSPRARWLTAGASILPAALAMGLLAAPADAAPTSQDPKVTTALPQAGEGDDIAAQKAPTRRGDKLGQHDRQTLARARAAGKKTVTALIATDRGAAPAVVRGVRALDGTVAYRDDKLGYVRAVVPVGAVERTAELSGIFSVDLNQAVDLIDPRPAASTTAAADVPAPGPETPDANPYMPTAETGATTFKKAHPTWDGRDVTIGILDSGVDLDHPALQTTTTGERKVVDWVTATDPLADGDLSWRAMLTQVSGPTFTAYSRTWTAPAGSFSVNRFTESVTAGSELAGDVNRDGDTTDTWGVLYRASDHAIWVDLDDDGDFTDEELRRPYREDQQVGHFGTDDPATAVAETVPFTVEYREDVDLSAAGRPGQTADFVNIGIVSSSHGTHVAGITAADGLFGGAMDGAAPGAKIVSSRACVFSGGCTSVALVEGMIDLVVNRRVDVVNLSIGGLPALNDGNNTRAELYDRLIADYGVQIFISAGNSGPGLNTVGDPSVADDSISVAASLSPATAQANYGSSITAKRLFPFSSRGPREDGGMKPDLSAPGSAVSTTPLWQAGAAVAETGYTLPPGYSMFNGTSMAAPQATGGAALLLSAGRATETAFTSAQLRTALTSSARFDEKLSAAAQGTGSLRLVQSWDLLERDSRLVPGQFDVVAPVCTPISDFLATADRGPGLYNRCAAGDGGQKAGQSKTYTVTVTRRSGASGTRTHTLRWLGDDGTFAAPATVRLPKNKAVSIKVTAKPGAGVHSAILKIDDAKTYGTEAYVPATIVASTPLASPSYGAAFTSRTERFSATSHFVTVAEGTRSLKVALSGVAPNSRLRFSAFNPYGLPVDAAPTGACYTTTDQCDARARSYADPIPGVWEIVVEASRTSPFLQNPFTLTAEAQSVAVDPPVTTLASVAVGTRTPLSWELTNQAGPVSVTAASGPLGSAKVDRPTIADGEVDSSEVVVPAGASRLDVAIGGTSDLGADLDLAVSLGGRVLASDADGDSEESVSIRNPVAGTYTVEVVGYGVPAGTTAYDYRDIFYTTSLGAIEIPATAVELGTGDTATLRGSLLVEAAPSAGRGLAGEVLLTEPDGGVVGRASVVVDEVTAGTVAQVARR